MIGYKVSDAKKLFFDKAKVLTASEKAEKKVLSKFGSFVRRDARKAIRKRKKSSKPGASPTNQTGLLKKFIFFVYDKTLGSVLVGPAKLNTSKHQNTLEVIEAGGKVIVEKDREPMEVDYAARPFMAPAFQSNKNRHMPGMWKDAIK